MTISDASPLISVVMPTLNGEKYIRDALYSVCHQSYKNFELLICDAGSTDATLAIVEDLGDPRVNVVSRSDKNLPDGINKGFSCAQGEIFAWLNCDDMYLHPDALSLVVQDFQKSPINYLVALCGMVSDSGDLYRVLLPWIVPKSLGFKGHSNVFTGALFFSSDIWKEFGGFSTRHTLAFEYELLKFLMNTPKRGVVESRLPIAGFRIRPDSLSGSNADKMRGQLEDVLGGSFDHPITLKHQLIRLLSYLTAGQLGPLLAVQKLNRQLPAPWHLSYSKK